MFNNAVNIPGSNPVFNHATQGNINLNVYHSSGSGRPRGFDWLLEHVATGALHNSGEVSDSPKCHPGTRVAILDSVFAWAAATSYLACIQWIYGPAGAGKSAILRTLAEMLERHGLLLASFFFFRAAAGRNNTDNFFPTIAYQMSCSITSTRRYIEGAIEADPLIFSRALEAQAQALIILPLTQAHKEGSIEKEYPRIIIVDGLDECHGEEKQRKLLRVLNSMLSKLPIPLAILIASRPEPHIRDVFNSDLNQTSTRLALDNSYKSDEDIQKFYEDKFLEICERHPLNSHFPKPWPPPPVIKTLVEKASGQFIFPATVIKFVEPHRHDPLQRLDMVMGSISPGKLKPFEALDDLYSAIFASIDPDDLKAVLTVLGILLVPFNILNACTTYILTYLAGYKETEIKRLLFDLESLLRVGDSSIRFHHGSLADFLFDQHRSGRFLVSPPKVYERLARRCMEVLLVSGDEPKLRILAPEFQLILHSAQPTEELVATIKNFDVASLFQQLKGKDLLWSLNVFLNQILPAVSSSALPDANLLHTHLLAMLRENIASTVDYCFNAKVTPLLVYLVNVLGSEAPRVIPDEKIYHLCSTQIFPIQGVHCPIEMAIQDQQTNSCLTLVFQDREFRQLTLREKLTFRILVNDIIGDRAGDCYADFAIHTLNWISRSPTIATLPDVRLHDDVQHISLFFLPSLLQKSAPRSDVQRALTDNPSPPITHDRFSLYATAIQEYFQRVNAASGHRDFHSNANPATGKR